MTTSAPTAGAPRVQPITDADWLTHARLSFWVKNNLRPWERRLFACAMTHRACQRAPRARWRDETESLIAHVMHHIWSRQHRMPAYTYTGPAQRWVSRFEELLHRAWSATADLATIFIRDIEQSADHSHIPTHGRIPRKDRTIEQQCAAALTAQFELINRFLQIPHRETLARLLMRGTRQRTYVDPMAVLSAITDAGDAGVVAVDMVAQKGLIPALKEIKRMGLLRFPS